MRRLKVIGFDGLVDISCRQINRSLCAQYMKCFDPPTKEVCIKGDTRVIGAEDVHQLMDLPCQGEPIKLNINDQNSIYKYLRSVYKNIAYKKIGDWLEEKLDENFEFLFVLFALGTLLAPSASIYVSDRLLKLMAVTKDAISHFDWSSFILQQLCEEIQEFKKDSQKSKRKKSKTVGGCLYFLMLFCFQNFPLGDVVPSPHQSPMAFWTDKMVKRRVLVEKRSKKCLLLRGKPRQPLPQSSVPPLHQASVPPSTSFDPNTMLTHLVVRSTYARMLSNLQQEMLALQHTLSEEGQHEGDTANNQPTTSEESDDDDEDGHDIEEGDDMDEGDQPEDIIDVEEILQHG
ncbi:hypothetical protein K1719_041250 [Acacia pycnantha]|nr:hypothetical protein K1719_041250 [Acacia pycnantha]